MSSKVQKPWRIYKNVAEIFGERSVVVPYNVTICVDCSVHILCLQVPFNHMHTTLFKAELVMNIAPLSCDVFLCMSATALDT